MHPRRSALNRLYSAILMPTSYTSRKTLKTPEYRLVSKRGDRLRKPPGATTPDDALPQMTAHEATNAGRPKAGVPTAAQTHFDSRDRLAGRLDDSTVRQAAEGEL